MFHDRIPDETKQRALAMMREGKTAGIVAKEIGVSDPTVRKWVRLEREAAKNAPKSNPVSSPAKKPPSPSSPSPASKPSPLKAALEGSGEIPAKKEGSSSSSSGAGGKAPITARGVLATCELVQNLALTAFCGAKKIDRRDPEVKRLLTLAPEEREMLEPLAEDAAPAWREVFGQEGPGAVYVLLGAFGLLMIVRIIDLNSRVPKKVPGVVHDPRGNESDSARAAISVPSTVVETDAQRRARPGQAIIPRDGDFLVSRNPAERENAAR